jgi:hypothetical protein
MAASLLTKFPSFFWRVLLCQLHLDRVVNDQVHELIETL